MNHRYLVLLSFVFLSAVSNADDYLQTPGGRRHRSLLQQVEPGQEVHLHALTASMLAANVDEPKVDDNGWITSSLWAPSADNQIQKFESTWTVPNDPPKRGQQLVYFFNGLMDAGNTSILQPVLQWGRSPAGGGPYWAIASWYVPTNGKVYYTKLVKVKPGQVLKGTMTLTGSSSDGFNYRSEFEGVPETVLSMNGILEMRTASETLEAYDVNDCANYPEGHTAFTGIGMDLSKSVSEIDWRTYTWKSECAQRTDIVDRSTTNGQVDLYHGQ